MTHCRHGFFQGITLALLIAVAPQGAGQSLFHCTDADGAPVFSDLPCTEDLPPERTRITIGLDNVIANAGLTAADLRQLERIDAHLQSLRRGGVNDGTNRDEEVACARARKALVNHRARARRPHGTSLLARGRELRASVREHCR